jgi:hypothetical protein
MRADVITPKLPRPRLADADTGLAELTATPFEPFLVGDAEPLRENHR